MAKTQKPPATPLQEASFRRRAEMPWAWQMQAHALIGTANVIWWRYWDRPRKPQRNPYRAFVGQVQPWPAMMLDGFALENLLKGLILARGVSATQGSRLSQDIKTHNLSALCARARIALNENERELLERVGRMLELGRYPVGADATMDRSLRLALPVDRKTMLGLLQRVDDEFKRVARASVNDDIKNLGVRPKRISGFERMRRIAMLHGTTPTGKPI